MTMKINDDQEKVLDSVADMRQESEAGHVRPFIEGTFEPEPKSTSDPNRVANRLNDILFPVGGGNGITPTDARPFGAKDRGKVTFVPATGGANGRRAAEEELKAKRKGF